MSIALLIFTKTPKSAEAGDDQGRLVPIATQGVFEAHWKRGCEALGLRWVPLFETGTPLRREDVRDVIWEMKQLRVWADQSGLPEEVLARMDTLAAELRELGSMSDIDIFIG